MIALDTPLQYLKGVGPRRAADLQRVGLSTVEDLQYRFPVRYEDRGSFQTISSLRRTLLSGPSARCPLVMIVCRRASSSVTRGSTLRL